MERSLSLQGAYARGRACRIGLEFKSRALAHAGSSGSSVQVIHHKFRFKATGPQLSYYSGQCTMVCYLRSQIRGEWSVRRWCGGTLSWAGHLGIRPGIFFVQATPSWKLGFKMRCEGCGHVSDLGRRICLMGREKWIFTHPSEANVRCDWRKKRILLPQVLYAQCTF